MKRVLFALILFSFSAAPVFSFEGVCDGEKLLVSSVNREVSRINYEMLRTKREIQRVRSSKYLSEYEKRRKIRKLEYELYSQKRAVRRLGV